MTILQREHSPDGILIHLEDWSCEYKAAKNATIALYPVAQNNIWLNMSVLQTEPAAMLSITSLRGLSRNNVVLHRFINPERIWKGKHYV